MIFHPKHSNLLRFEIFNQFEPSLCHFSTTVNAGVSQGDYSSFNMSIYSGDDIECVDENRNRLALLLDIDEDKLFIPYQTHEDKTAVIDEEFLSKSDLEQAKMLHGIDSIITNQKNICIGITTADCVPIIIYDPINKVLACVHAGWRGTLAKLSEKTIFEMQKRFDCKHENLIAGIGPFISEKYFEVGDEVFQSFSDAGFFMEEISSFNVYSKKYHLDLGSANKQLFRNIGIPDKNVEISDYCTFREKYLFFSARRQGIKSGRMLTGGYIR